MKLLKKARCFWRGVHEPVRHPLSGFRCACGKVAGDLSEMGFGIDAGHVSHLRHLSGLDGRSTIRTTDWSGRANR